MQTTVIAVLLLIITISAADQFEDLAFNIGIETNLCENSGTNGNFHVEILYANDAGEKFQLQFDLFENDEDVYDQFQNGNIGKFTIVINGTSISGNNLEFVVLHLDDCSDNWLPNIVTLEHYNWQFEWFNDEPCDAGNSYWVTCEAPLIVYDHRYDKLEERNSKSSRTTDEL